MRAVGSIDQKEKIYVKVLLLLYVQLEISLESFYLRKHNKGHKEFLRCYVVVKNTVVQVSKDSCAILLRNLRIT